MLLGAMRPAYPKMSFTFSKKDELRRAGRFSTSRSSPNCCKARRCSRVSLVGVITRTLT